MDRKIILIEDKKRKYFAIYFNYDKELVESVRLLPSRKFDSNEKYWKVYADPITSIYVQIFAKQLSFEISSDAQEFIDSWKKENNIDIPDFKIKLRSFQKDGIKYATKYKKCFIADEPGLGKTCQSIISVQLLNAYPCLVICPASLKLNWRKEINMWTDRSAQILDGLIDEKDEDIEYNNSDFIIVNYDILNRSKESDLKGHKDILKKIPFKSIICDESQYLINKKSLRTKAVRELSKNIPIRYLLTGTPILNRPSELIAQLEILDLLESFGGDYGFKLRYCDAKETFFGLDSKGYSNLDELYNKLQTAGFIRRRKKDVLDELPEKQRIMIPIEIDNIKQYKSLEKNFSEWLISSIELTDEEKKNAKGNDTVLKAILESKMQKMLIAESMIKIEKLKQIVAQGKLKKIMEIIDNAIENDENIVIFARHQEIYKQLIEKYRNICVSITKGATMAQRQQAVDDFQQNDKIKLFIGSLDSAGVGITLTKSNTVFFVEFGWNPSVHEQAEDRTHRIGQKNFVKCYYFYGEKTIEEDILELINEKRKVINNISDGISMIDEPQEKDLEKMLLKFI